MSAAANMGTGPRPDAKFVARAFLRLGQWRWAVADDMDDSTLTDVLTAFRTATDACHNWAKAWHNWALFNAAAMEHYQRVAPAAATRSASRASLARWNSRVGFCTQMAESSTKWDVPAAVAASSTFLVAR